MAKQVAEREIDYQATPGAKVDKFDPRIIAAKPEWNVSRAVGYTSKDPVIKERVAQFLKDGQRVPVEVVELAEDDPLYAEGFRYRLITGFSRHFAALEIVKNGKDAHIPDGFKLAAFVKKGFDPDAVDTLIASVQENTQRRDLTPFDELNVIETLKAKGANNRQVAEALGRDASWISEIAKLRTLPAEEFELAQKGYALGKIGKRAVVDAVALPPKVREDLFRDAAEGIKVPKSTVQKTLRKEKAKAAARGEDESKVHGGTGMYSTKEIKALIAEFQRPGEHPFMKELAGVLLLMIGGKIAAQTFRRKVNKLEGEWLIPIKESGDQQVPVCSRDEILEHWPADEDESAEEDAA